MSEEMDKKDKESINPLRVFWGQLGAIGSVLGLSSMVENWSRNLVKWEGFIGSLVSGYRSVVEPLMDLLLGWLPFSVPRWIGDYLFIGILILSSRIKAAPAGSSSILEEFRSSADLSERLAFLGSFPTVILLWPIYVFELVTDLVVPFIFRIYLKARGVSFSKEQGSKWVGEDQTVSQVLEFQERQRVSAIRAFLWLATFILGFIILLSINTQLQAEG